MRTSDETSNPAQIAPGEEAGRIPLDEPYSGAPGNYGHVGYPLNGMFRQGLADATDQY
jgi:hypothetical protein